MKPTNNIKHLIKEIVDQLFLEAYQKFNYNYFKKLQDVNDILPYVRYTLPVLGEGSSSRIVFNLGKNRVLKIAKDQKGIDQNKTEYEIAHNPNAAPAVTAVAKEANPNFLWIIAQSARILTNEEEFKKLLGFSWASYIDYLRRTIKGGSAASIKQTQAAGADAKEKEGYEKALQQEQAAVESSYLTKGILVAMKENGLLPGDVYRLEHYGKTANGKVVLIDSGFSEEVWEKHKDVYSGERMSAQTVGSKPSSSKPKPPTPTTPTSAGQVATAPRKGQVRPQ